MMAMATFKRLFLFIVVSTMITIVNLVIAAVYSFYVPVVIVSDETNLSMAMDKERIYTLDELVEAERKMDEQLRILKEEHRKKSLKEILQDEKKHAIYVCWIPWILVPFLLRINHWRWGLALLSIPSVLVPTGLFLPFEILIFAGCLYLGNQLKHRVFSTV